MESILGTIVGFLAFGIIWFFLLRPKNNEAPADELKFKEEELKNSQINLATRDAEVKAAEDAKQDLIIQLDEKKEEVKDLYKKVDDITKGVGEYKSISEKAINKHDVFGTKIKNWFEKLTTNVTYQGKFNQQILENLLLDANLVRNRDFFAQKKQTTYDVDEDKDKDVIPDILLKFPERNYIIDAKVSLADWTKYVDAVKSNKEEDKKLADKYLKDHTDSVRKHLFGPKGLDKKNYNKLYGINSLKHVIVFFPADELYTITLKGDISLQNDAFKKGFIFSSPNNLNNLIAVFEQIKSEKKQIENIGKIITSASKIFDKYSDVKTAIKGALESYRAHANKLQNIVTKSWGTQGLEKQIKKLEDEHGVIPGKQIPEIPVEQSTIVDISDPEEDKDKLN
jgi:DNA anti-recombination protein RmuC